MKRYKNLLRREQVIEVKNGDKFTVHRALSGGYFEFPDEAEISAEVALAIKSGNIMLAPNNKPTTVKVKEA